LQRLLLIRHSSGHNATELRTGSFKALPRGSQVRLIGPNAFRRLLKRGLLKVGKTRHVVARRKRFSARKRLRALHKRKASGLNFRGFAVYSCLSLSH
jgi:hypothetical protein